ncbi:hypothetical protein N2152v2_002558 [Parachlorella kessleri]
MAGPGTAVGALQDLLDAYLSAKTLLEQIRFAKRFHSAVESVVASRRSSGGGGDIAKLLELLRSEQAAAAAANLALSNPLHAKLQRRLQKPEETLQLTGEILESGACSHVALGILRCLLSDGVCSQLGTSSAYRLASSVQSALGPGEKSALLVVEYSQARATQRWTTVRPLEAWLAGVLCTHLEAVDLVCQLLVQQAGSRLQEALQRTVCQPYSMLVFLDSIVAALEAVEKDAPGAVSKNSRLWTSLASLLAQLFPLGTPAVSLLPGGININLHYWPRLEYLVVKRLQCLLSVPVGSVDRAWAEQWACISNVIGTAARHLAKPPMPLERTKRLEFLPWHTAGCGSTIALLSAGTLRLLRIVAVQQSGSGSTGLHEQLCQAAGTGGLALLSTAQRGLKHGSSLAPQQQQACLEAITLGFAALQPMAEGLAWEGRAAGTAAQWLRETAFPILQLLVDTTEHLQWPSSGSKDLQEASRLPAAAAAAAEAAMRLAALCLQLAAQQRLSSLAQQAATGMFEHGTSLAERLFSNIVISRWLQGWKGGWLQLTPDCRQAFEHVGLTAAKLAVHLTNEGYLGKVVRSSTFFQVFHTYTFDRDFEERKLALLKAAMGLLEAVSRILPTTAPSTKHERMAAYSAQVRQLGTATEVQLASLSFWEEVRLEVLPAMLSLSLDASDDTLQAQPGSRVSKRKERQQQQQQQQKQKQQEQHCALDPEKLAAARALASRPCANLLCANVRGCSEGRLRGRRCSGCGVPWLVDVVGTHLAAVDIGCQLLLQQAGSQLQQALQRTVCPPVQILVFWRAVLNAMAAVLQEAPDKPLLLRFDANPYNLACWGDVQELTDARLLYILSARESRQAGAWDKQWGCLVAAVSASANHLSEPSLSVGSQFLRQCGSAVLDSWPLDGRRNTLVLLTAGTLRLLRSLQSQQGRPQSSASRRRLCHALGNSGVALLSVAKLGLKQGQPSVRQVQSCMEATALGLAVMHPMVDAMAERGAAGTEAANWLATAGVSALQRLARRTDNGDKLWEEAGTEGSPVGRLQAPDLPVAAAEAAEAALRLSTACMRLAAQQPCVPGRLLVAASIASYSTKLAKQLLDECAARWQNCRWAQHGYDALLGLGLSATKLALVSFGIAASLPPDSTAQAMCAAVAPETGVMFNMYQSVTTAISSPGPRTDHMLAVQVAKHGCLGKLVSRVKSLASSSPVGFQAAERLRVLEGAQRFCVAVSFGLQAACGSDYHHQPLEECTAQVRNASAAQIQSKRFWEGTVEGGMLPLLLRAAALAAKVMSERDEQEQQEQQPQQRQEALVIARALALRPCANPMCTNVRGCSEGRLRGRRCSGCGVVRYCSRECQLQHWQQHGPLCATLFVAEDI